MMSCYLQYDWYFEEEEGEPPVEPSSAAEELSPAPAPSRDLLIHNVKKIEGECLIRMLAVQINNRSVRKKMKKSIMEKKTFSKYCYAI